MDRISFGKAVNLGYSDLEDMEYIGKIGGYEVYRQDYDYGDYVGTAFDVIDPNVVRGKRQPTYKRVMEIELAQEYSKAWHVNISRVDKKYQGEGLSFRIYRFLLSKIPGFVLQAGTSQSPGGAYILYKLSQFKDVLIYGRTKAGRPAMMIPNDELREMQCYNPSKDAYDSDKEFYMFAMKCA